MKKSIALFEEKNPKGEFVLVLEGAIPETEPQKSLEDAIEEAMQLVAEGERPTEAAKKISAQYGYKKSEIYNGLI